MFKQFLAAIVALCAATAFAAVDVNKANQADLESVQGIGPGIAGKILDERKKGAFKDWDDMITRVKGIGEGSAAKLSAGGLTVGGAPYKGVAAAGKKDDKPAATAKKDDKPAVATKKDDKAAAVAPTATTAPAAAKADDKPAAKDDKKVMTADAKKDDKKAAAKPEDAASKPATKK